MADLNDLRRIAMALPGTEEAPHMERRAFRVKRIYATVPPDGLTANLMLTPDEQELKCQLAPDIFMPVPKKWGERGATTITLNAASEAELEAALRMAHAHAVNKR